MNEIQSKIRNRVEKFINSDTDECLEYHYIGGDGYGQIQFYHNGKNNKYKPHRLVYELLNNCILTPKELILHKCDNPPCCNPKHLFKGTDLDNVLDKVAKGRQAKGKKHGRYKTGYYSKFDPVKKPEPVFESLHSRSLTKEQAIEIKKILLNKGYKTYEKISEETGVKISVLIDIARGKTYKNVQIPTSPLIINKLNN